MTDTNIDTYVELESIKNGLLELAQTIGLDIKSLKESESITAKKLTGLDIDQSGVIEDTDSVLSAFGKLQNQINNLDIPTVPTIIIAKYTLNNSTNLDDVSLDGFHIASGSAPNLNRNYPIAESGCLTHIKINYSTVQEYLTVTGVKYVRGYDGSTWSPWSQI